MNKKRLAFPGKRDKQVKTQSLEEENSTVLFAMNSHSQNNEHKSYTKESNILPLDSKKHSQRPPKKKKVIRPIVVASASAVVIGAILGFVMLNMFAQLEENPVNSVAHIDSIQKSDDTTETNNTGVANAQLTTMMLDAINGFVLQAGVFSTEENADAWSTSFVENGFPTVIWERDQQYYLLAGIAHTRENAEELASTFEQHDLEIFIKEWNTPPVELQITPEEKEWLESLKGLWDSSLTSLTAQETVDIQEWDAIMSNVPESNEAFASFKDAISGIQNDGEQLNRSDASKMLLTIWQTFEELGN